MKGNSADINPPPVQKGQISGGGGGVGRRWHTGLDRFSFLGNNIFSGIMGLFWVRATTSCSLFTAKVLTS